jgi:hypothetical protein
MTVLPYYEPLPSADSSPPAISQTPQAQAPFIFQPLLQQLHYLATTVLFRLLDKLGVF